MFKKYSRAFFLLLIGLLAVLLLLSAPAAHGAGFNPSPHCGCATQFRWHSTH